MGEYTTRVIDDNEYKQLIRIIRNGYVDHEGVKHRPNNQIATILVLESNLGCRLIDIINLTTESITQTSNKTYILDITEQKTNKRRVFVVPKQIKAYIDKYCKANGIVQGRLFSVTKQAVWKAMRQATAYLGMENVSTHSMRKRAGQLLYEKSGYDIALVSQFYQHSDTSITLKYLKKNTKQMENAINSMVNLA